MQTTRRALTAAAGLAAFLAVTSCSSSDRAAAPTSTVPAPSTPIPQAPERPVGSGTGVMFGVSLDWSREQLAEYASHLGHNPAVAVNFSGFPLTDTDRTNVEAAAGQVRRQGAVLLLTLEPNEGLSAASTEGALSDLVTLLTRINDSGVGVIVRFGQEMNGSWYAWGQQPTAYVEAFRKLAAAVHSTASSATMWAPNYGGGYPFSGGRYVATEGTADFDALDTNHDGIIDGTDDPYAPYYPGDAAVDWVGMSLYHWGNTYPWGANVVAEPDKFVRQLTGTYTGAGGNDLAVPDFYAEYAVGRSKPLAIAETAALVNTERDASNALAIKQEWWQQVLAADIPTRFPALRMVNWFEWDKYEAEVRARVDWTVTQDPDVRAAFAKALPQWLEYGS
ncbi:glycoside hydrolase family 26 protein [Aestuariimicrobium sp. T2.26MG-19.2B]|uniref:glycoside hydrolase family 26 protein n=1 Tax=Aestuariimicrobium sp. T2.26MG-19.2B TaxID=3040679 RepID=UPI00253FFF94|nr:glycosyl hydrolase [Aestuariimicrobium sp. T2.26MG-19.2B]